MQCLLEISTDRIHLPLVNADTTVLDEGSFGVVQLGRTIAVGVVGNLVKL